MLTTDQSVLSWHILPFCTHVETEDLNRIVSSSHIKSIFATITFGCNKKKWDYLQWDWPVYSFAVIKIPHVHVGFFFSTYFDVYRLKQAVDIMTEDFGLVGHEWQPQKGELKHLVSLLINMIPLLNTGMKSVWIYIYKGLKDKWKYEKLQACHFFFIMSGLHSLHLKLIWVLESTFYCCLSFIVCTNTKPEWTVKLLHASVPTHTYARTHTHLKWTLKFISSHSLCITDKLFLFSPMRQPRWELHLSFCVVVRLPVQICTLRRYSGWQ